MALNKNVYTLRIDIKSRTSNAVPSFVQYDDARLDFIVYDGGAPYDVSGFTSVEFTHILPGGAVVIGAGVITADEVGNTVIRYDYQGSEMHDIGIVLTSFAMFDAEGDKVSVHPFRINIVDDLRDEAATPANPEYGVLQDLIVEVDSALDETYAATEYANMAGDYANAKGEYIASKEPLINKFTTEQTALQTQINDLTKGLTVDAEVIQARGGKATLNDRISAIDGHLSDTARQTTTLGTGVAVVNASVDALASAEIEGRTLTSLGNSNLEANKKYVLADKKTKVIVDGATQSGVAKFTKGTTTVSTANFVGKVSGSTVANPHTIKYRAGVVTSLPTPQESASEGAQSAYTNAQSLNGVLSSISKPDSGSIAHNLFSFDIIAEIERKLGLIPRNTLAEKVAWIKENVSTFVANWHGFGSGPLGNKANFTGWANGGTYDAPQTHTNAVVAKLSFGISSPSFRIDDNGFVHLLAYAEPSDGVTASTINTDYIDLVVTLKATAQLNTRPTIIRVENFEGKVSGSTVENAHVIKFGTTTTLITPTQGNETSGGYLASSKLDGSPYSVSRPSIGEIAQHLFSFNLIEAVERNIGRIPRTTVADKVAWLKVNVGRLTANWFGFGSSVGGNKATFVVYSSSWINTKAHTKATVDVISQDNFTMTAIQSDGFAHFLAYAEPSDGTTPSVINTDYIDLEIEIKPNADFTQPKIALYEVDDATYNKILVDWDADTVVNRFPIVEGTQHLQGVGVIAEGENLLPPFSEWTLHANAKVISPYELELDATVAGQDSWYHVPVINGQVYTINGIGTDGIGRIYKKKVSAHASINEIGEFTANSVTFTVDSSYEGYVSVRLTSRGFVQKFTFKNPMLTLGSTAKPFVPRNPSYLFADVKLGAIGSTRDYLYEQDGRWLLRKSVEKDVVLDGSLAWVLGGDKVGFKAFGYVHNGAVANVGKVTKYDGKSVPLSLTNGAYDTIGETAYILTTSINVSVNDTDTGFAEAYTPTANVIKRYFNGWKYVDGTTWTSVTGNGQTATGQVALDTKPTDYTPYKLSYVLATPQIVDVTDKVEGALKVGGVTQVEVLSGVVRREKANPRKINDGTQYRINSMFDGDSRLSNRASRILTVYKNGTPDYTWTIVSSLDNGWTNGNSFAWVKTTNFDPTAEYTVTYLALDKPKLTVNPTNVKLTYANSVRNALDDTVTNVQDAKTMLSVHERAIVDLYVKYNGLVVPK